MSRAEELATRFEQENERYIQAVLAYPEGQWASRSTPEGWTTAAVAQHVAGGHLHISEMIGGLASGQPLPGFTAEVLNENNNQQAEQFANASRAEVLGWLRSNGKQAAAVVRGLSDDQLACSAPFALMGGAQVSAAQLIENVLIGHIASHG